MDSSYHKNQAHLHGQALYSVSTLPVDLDEAVRHQKAKLHAAENKAKIVGPLKRDQQPATSKFELADDDAAGEEDALVATVTQQVVTQPTMTLWLVLLILLPRIQRVEKRQ